MSEDNEDDKQRKHFGDTELGERIGCALILAAFFGGLALLRYVSYLFSK